MKSRRNITLPTICTACSGSGVIQGACMPLVCLDCEGIGWQATAGQDLTVQLGRALTKARQMNRLLQAQVPPTDERSLYQNNKRGGARGNYTGD